MIGSTLRAAANAIGRRVRTQRPTCCLKMRRGLNRWEAFEDKGKSRGACRRTGIVHVPARADFTGCPAAFAEN